MPGAWPGVRPTSVRGADRSPGAVRSGERTASDVVSVLGVELDDQLLGQDRVDLGPGRQLVDEDLKAARHDLHPGRDRTVAEGLARQLEREGLDGLLAHRDDVVLLDPVGRHVDAHAVDQEVTVGHELAGHAAGTGQAGAVDDVVETGLEDRQDVLTGLAGAVGRLLVVPAELLLHDAVGEASLLLLLQLGEVLLLLDPATAVLAGREGTEVEVLVAADEVGLEPARLLGDGSGVTGHCSLTFREVSWRSDAAALGRANTVVRARGDVLDRTDLEAGCGQGTDGGLATGARALDEDVDLAHAVLHGATRSSLGRGLRGIRRGLAGTLEAHLAGR